MFVFRSATIDTIDLVEDTAENDFKTDTIDLTDSGIGSDIVDLTHSEMDLECPLCHVHFSRVEELGAHVIVHKNSSDDGIVRLKHTLENVTSMFSDDHKPSISIFTGNFYFSSRTL